MHVLLVAQSATARALGGPEGRGQFATRILTLMCLRAVSRRLASTPGDEWWYDPVGDRRGAAGT